MDGCRTSRSVSLRYTTTIQCRQWLFCTTHSLRNVAAGSTNCWRRRVSRVRRSPVDYVISALRLTLLTVGSVITPFHMYLLSVILLLLAAPVSDACSRQRAHVRLSCPSNVARTAEPRSTTALVSWSRRDFNIDSTHSIKGIYQTVPIYGASSTVRRRFREGIHYVEYKAVDETGSFDSCSFSVSVSVIRCITLYNPLFGVLSCDAANVYGSTCSVSCIPGYSVVGKAHVKCGRDRQWSGDIPFCRITTCPDPGTPIGGARFCTTPTHAYGSVCSFDCSRGTKLIGHDRLICKSSGGRTFWSGATPVCEEVVPPVVELCPDNIQITTGEPLTEVQRPSVVFRTTKGGLAPFVCSSFGSELKHSFPLGTHHITCTAFDPDFGDSAPSTCSFIIKVKANPCRALVHPLHGHLLCSRAHGGGSSMHDTACKLFCDAGLSLPRSDGHVTDQYECDNTGTWQPSSRVPSCVRPKRPLELRMPAEILYRTDDCSTEAIRRRLQSEFQASLQLIIRLESACASNPGDCIVEDVVATCGNRRSRRFPSKHQARVRRHPNRHRPRSRRYKTRESPRRVRRVVPSRRQRYQRQQAQLRRRRGRGSQPGQFVMPVQLHLATRVPETVGQWPDQYHSASRRLFEMFDYFEKQVMAGTFRLRGNLNVSVVNDSLTFDHVVAECDMGYQFNKDILYCVPCGAGTFYHIEREECALCSVGDYQNQEAKFSCKRCPDGTTSVERGATNATQCVEIDECQSSPCLNYGQCYDMHASYSCECQPGFSGSHCEIKVYDCYVHSCQSDGQCRPVGELNYTCECTAGYTGDYCEYDSVDGQWSSWSEWTVCSKSCRGGVTTRNRTCDSPSPGNGGRPCGESAIQEKVCNLHACPACRRLRRPYRGSMQCVNNTSEDLMTCTVQCPSGYDFAGQMSKRYSCGRNTSYLWPHESPDNPRCVLPACTRMTEAILKRYDFRSSLQVVCRADDDETRLKRDISKQAVSLTSQLSCIRDGSCKLDTPTVTGCHQRTRRQASGDTYDGLSYVEFEVSITRDSPSTTELSQNEASQELARFGDDLANRSARNDLFIVVDGRRLSLEPDNTTTSKTLVCPGGSVASSYGEYCVECSPGSFYNATTRICVRCDVGYYQSAPAQSACIICPDAKTTYGRGARFEIECYNSDDTPPTIPLDYVGDSSSDVATGGLPVYIVIILVAVCGLAVLIVAITLIRLRRRYYANYSVVRKASEARAETTTADTAATLTPTQEPEELKLWKAEEHTAEESPTDTTTRTAVV